MEEGRFLDNPDQQRLALIVSALTAEVSVLSDRLATVLAVAEERGLFSEAEVQGYRPDAAQSAAWQDARQAMIARVFDPILAEGGE